METVRKTSCLRGRIFRSIGAICICMLFVSGGVWAGTYSGGDGSAGNPYQIRTVADWQELINTPDDWLPGKNFVLTADIDFGGATITPVAPDTSTSSGFQGAQFRGVLDGAGYVVHSFVMDQTGIDYVGLFGYVGSGGQIKNLGIESFTITGRQYVGGLCGYNTQGMLSQCYATGSVTGSSSYVGGLCGYHIYGTLSTSYVSGSVTGSSSVGGLCGSNSRGTLSQCYATGAVAGSSSVGGLCGSNHFGTISASYATGVVTGTSDVGGLCGVSGTYSTTRTSFWDIQTTGQIGSGAGKGLTTEQMKMVEFYQKADWAGTNWVMQEGDYPRLAWENTDGAPIPAALPIPLVGSGTQASPYEIGTPEDFALLSWYAAVLDKYIVLKVDLDLTDVALWPVGDLGPFTGVFDGRNHVIANAVMDRPESDGMGLFAHLGTAGELRNLKVRSPVITGRRFVGGLCAHVNGTIFRCGIIDGVVTGYSSVGGLCGYMYYTSAKVNQSYASGSVSAAIAGSGGLCGYLYLGLKQAYSGCSFHCGGDDFFGRSRLLSPGFGVSR